MKRIAIFLVLLLLVALAVPYYMGMRAEQHLLGGIAVANRDLKASANGGEIRLADYRRGWLNSQGRIEFKLPAELQGLAAKPLALGSALQVAHGPLPGLFSGDLRPGMASVRVESRIQEWLASLDLPLPEAFRQSLTAYPPIQVDIRVAFDQSAQWGVKAEPYQFQDPEGGWRLDWTALRGQGHTGSNQADTTGRLALERIEVSAAEQLGRVTLGGLELDFDLKQHGSGLYLGQTSFSLKELEGKMEQATVKLVGLGVFADTGAEDGALRMRLNYRLGALEVAADGENHKGSGEMGFSLSGLDLASLKKLADAAGTLEDDGDLATLLPSAQQFATASLKYGPALSISPLSIQYDASKITGELNLALAKMEPSQLAAGMEVLLSNLKGNAKLAVPEALAQEMMQHYLAGQLAGDEESPDDDQATQDMVNQTARQLIDQAIGDGWIQRRQKDLVGEAQLDKGKLTVNGKTLYEPSKR